MLWSRLKVAFNTRLDSNQYYLHLCYSLKVQTIAMVFKKEEKQDHFWDRLRLYEELPKEYQLVTGFALFTSGIALQFVGSAVYRRYFRRIPNSDWVTPDILTSKRVLKGRVTRYTILFTRPQDDKQILFSVGDNDNFRLYHTPGFAWNWPLKLRRVPSTSKGSH